MKFQPDRIEGVNVISGHEPGAVFVNAQPHRFSVLVPWRGEILPWNCNSFAELGAPHFESLVALQPELVIFGSGARLRFAPPAALRPLIERRIGFECMDTGAACRTYNVLAAEGRSVVAALLIEASRGEQPV